MQRIVACLAGIAALALAAAALAGPAPLSAYGELPAIEQLAISPNGQLLALEMVKGADRTVIVQDLVAKKILTGVNVGQSKLRGLLWAGNNHVLLEFSSTTKVALVPSNVSEYFTLTDFNLTNHKLTPLLGDVNLSMNAIAAAPAIRMIGGKPTILATSLYLGGEVQDEGDVWFYRNRLALFRIDLETDRSRLVSEDSTDTVGFVVGADGQPAAEATYEPLVKRWELKVRSGGGWRVAQSLDAPIDTPDLMGLGRDGRSILIANLQGDRKVLQEVSADGATVSDPLPGPAGGAPIDDPVTHRLIGTVAYEGDDLTYFFYDRPEELQWLGILAAFPGQRVSIVSTSDDRRKLVLRIESPTDGPGFALVDLANRSSQWLGSDYPALTSADISEVQSISFRAADGTRLTGYLTLPRGRDPKNLPLVVFPHGGPAARDAPGFDWWAQAMASRGYAVLQVNYRGSEGLGRKLLTAGYGEFGRKMQTDLSDGVRYLAGLGSIDPKRVCIVGGSYGGYAALAGATIDTGVYRCAVDIAGLSELGKFIAWGVSRNGDGGALAERYWLRFMGAKDPNDPVLRAISPADLADKVTIPILIIHGKDDTVVPFEQSQMMADALAKAGKPYQMVILNHEDHWLSQSDTRLQMLQATIDFLEKNNPPD
ncbi:MAG TPA: S9 family peptidase [Caulobacteraceae bacterium]|nr:S9 family peptidase [Caulobacteraceae bacterium]